MDSNNKYNLKFEIYRQREDQFKGKVTVFVNDWPVHTYDDVIEEGGTIEIMGGYGSVIDDKTYIAKALTDEMNRIFKIINVE